MILQGAVNPALHSVCQAGKSVGAHHCQRGLRHGRREKIATRVRPIHVRIDASDPGGVILRGCIEERKKRWAGGEGQGKVEEEEKVCPFLM